MTRPLTVVLVHNRYQQPGGEDIAVDDDAALLTGRGHRVVRFERDNDEIDALGRARVAAGTVWAPDSARQLAAVLDRDRPDVVHVHNTFPLLSPAVYAPAARRGIPVVQSVHNYRWTCAVATLNRDGRPCEECVGHLPWPAVRHRCYHGSLAGSAVVATMLVTHRVARTLDRRVGLFLPVSHYVARTMIDAGAIPPDRVMVRHNHTPDPGEHDLSPGHAYVVCAGRISPEKGVETLVRAAARVPGLAVAVVGDGPDRERVERVGREVGAEKVMFSGWKDRQEVSKLLLGARCAVVPSTQPEPFGLVAAEAAALGVPSVVSAVGGLPEVVTGESGWLVPPGDVDALAGALAEVAADPEGCRRRGRAARRRWEANFAPDRAYDRLMEAYRRVGVG